MTWNGASEFMSPIWQRLNRQPEFSAFSVRIDYLASYFASVFLSGSNEW